MEVSVTHGKGASEVCFCQCSKNDTNYDCRHGKLCLIHKVSEETTEYHYKYIVHGIVISIGTNKSKSKNNRDQDLFWNIYNLDKYSDQRKSHKTHNCICQKKADKNCIYRACLLFKKQWSRLHSLNHQCSKHDCCRTITWNAESQHRDHRTTGYRVVSGLRSNDTFRFTIAKIIFIF